MRMKHPQRSERLRRERVNAGRYEVLGSRRHAGTLSQRGRQSLCDKRHLLACFGFSFGGVFGWAVVECPLHGAQFDVTTGKVLSAPADRDIKTYEVTIADGRIFVAIAWTTIPERGLCVLHSTAIDTSDQVFSSYLIVGTCIEINASITRRIIG
jgi:hypothetical protein